MTTDRSEPLEDDDFRLHANDDRSIPWTTRYEELKRYKEEKGHSNVPSNYSKNKSLGIWVNQQRTQYKMMNEGRVSSMTFDKIQALDAIDFSWKTNEDSNAIWALRYEDLKRFKSEKGHCEVPNKYSANISLGKWVHNQRRQHRLMKEGKKSAMNSERIHSLEAIGFLWQVNEDRSVLWATRYEELRQFNHHNGHCQVPQKYNENISLGYWVDKQRRQYRLMKEGKTSSMTENRIQALESVGFTWQMYKGRSALWVKRYEELKQYKIQRGHCEVPRKYSPNRSLGMWVNNQRTQYRLMKEGKPSAMTSDRIQALEALTFTWQVNDDKSLLRIT